MRKVLYIMTLVVAMLFSACGSVHEYAYITDAERDQAEVIIDSYCSVLMPGDELSIDLTSAQPESLVQFYQRSNKKNRMSATDSLRVTYLVDTLGQIQFPMVGRITVAGITTDSLQYLLSHLLRDSALVTDPQVTVTRTNFRVTVIGEVANPRQLHIEGQRLTIFEALAMTGDITIYGQRENVMVMRYDNGQQDIGTVDLTTANVLDSPYYYLHQNDIVYVEPDRRRKRIAKRDPNVPIYISLGVSLVRLISNINLRSSRVGDYR